jgi:hypothetical protein
MFWFIYPYPDNPSQDVINTVWGVHVLAEKLFGHLIIVILSIYVVYQFKITHGFKSVFLAILGGVSYNIIGGIIWIARYGYEPYFEHSLPLKLLFLVIIVSGVTSLVSYKWLPNKAIKRD